MSQHNPGLYERAGGDEDGAEHNGAGRSMAKMREEGKTPWMPADEYGRSLKGFTLNLLVRNVPRSVAFCREVLQAQAVYSDADFAVMRRDCRGAMVEWMLHADHTYGAHPLLSLTGDGVVRGAGAEFRLHGVDPDQAAAAAARRGDTILSPPADKPHGTREAFIADPDGYIWVPDIPLPA
jgi:catechol 2,3-dioxygenase-like lactoylglutathione lyase family enzyme